MSDTFTNDVTDYTSAARNRAVGALDMDPDEAAQALRLSKYTGVPSTAIAGDIDSFVSDQKAKATSDIVHNNPYIADYINSHPLAAQVSNDDLGNLDELSSNLQKFHSQTFLQKLHNTIGFGKAAEAAYPDDPLAAFKQIDKPPLKQTKEEKENDEWFSATYPNLYKEARDLKSLFELGLTTVSTPISGALGLANRYLGREGAAVLEHEIMRGDIQASGTPGELLDGYKAAQPWLKKNLDPPVGIHPQIDNAKVQQTKTDIEALDDSIKSAGKTETLERSPESVANFNGIHGDREIGINAEAIKKLYGDKVPEADDSLLGWIPDLQNRLDSARQFGGDVWVPSKDYIANIAKDGPELHKELRDSLRVRDGAITLDEAKELEPKETIDEPLQQIRGSSGMEPMFQVGDRKIRLDKKPTNIDEKTGVVGGDRFSLLDETGRDIGRLKVTPMDGGKRLYVDNISANRALEFGPNSFGPALTRSLIGQLKEAYPGLQEIGGFRISGARGKAGTMGDVWIKVQVGDAFDAATHQRFRNLLSQNWEEVGNGVSALFDMEGKGLAANSVMGQMLLEEAHRIIPGAESDVAHALYHEPGGSLFGVHIPNLRSIIVSLESDDPFGTLRHEATHELEPILRSMGLWDTLEKASRDEGWVGKYDVAERWKNFPTANLASESIAEAYRDWRAGAGMPPEVHGIFEKIKAFFEGLRQRLGEMLGHDLTWEQIFEKIDSGEIGAREFLGKAVDADDIEAKTGIQMQPSDEGPGLFDRAKALGVTQTRMDRILAAIEKRNASDLESSRRRLEVRGKALSDREWKARRTDIRDQVREAVSQRPDIAANQFFTTSDFKIHPDFLTDEQKAVLPKDFIQKKNGVNPDELAGHFGYPTGDALVDHLAMLSEDRKRSGMSPRDYFNRLVDVETDRRLNAEFGDRQQNVLDQAYEQALSENQLSLTHEQTMAYANAAGVDPKFSLEDVKGMVRNAVDKMSLKELDPVKLLRSAGATGKKIDDATSEGNHQEAYRLMQARQYAEITAKIAVDYQREQHNLDRLFRTYAKIPTKEVAKRVEQSYYNYVQETMVRVGQKIRRTQAGLASAIDKEGYKSLDTFVSWKESMLRDLGLPEFLKNQGSKSLDKMNYEEFTSLHNFIKRMDNHAREERQINREGEKADLDQTIDDIVDRLPETLPHRPPSLDRQENRFKESSKSWWWSLITLRSMAKRLDRGDPNGLLTQLVANTATAADASKTALSKKYATEMRDIGKIPDMDKMVDNALFKDPETGTPILFRRRNVLGIIGHWGNPSSRTKLLKGWEVDHEAAEDWLKRNSTVEDWDRHEKIGNILAEVFNLADRMAHQVNGVGIEGLRLEPFVDPHGVTRKGWYNPAKYEDLLPGASHVALGANALEREGMFKASTNQGYAQARTGYVAPLELSLDAIPMRIEQMLHDIAWRPAILEMSKIIYNQKFQRAIIARYGRHQMEEFKSYLKDMAGGSNSDSLADYYRNSVFEYFRRNTISTLIGFNPATVAKHALTAGVNSITQVGLANFSREFAGMFRTNDEYGTSQLKMAYEKSEIIQDRMGNIAKLIRGHDPKFSFEEGKFAKLREVMMHLGSFPVALGDFMSAVPTWLAEYKKQIADHGIEGRAIANADRAVIEAHGSALPSNQPAIMRTNSLGHSFTSLYGFFSHMLQKQYEFAWKAKDIWNGEKPLDITGHWAGPMMANLWSYWIAPALIEELITPYTNKEKESWGVKAAKTIGFGVSSSLAMVRDLFRPLFNERGEFQFGILGASGKSLVDLSSDLKKNQPFSKEHAGKVIKDATTTAGMLTGLTNAQQGRTAEYVYRYAHGLERPQGPWDLGTGIRYGHTTGHSRSFKEWWNHMVQH